MSTASQGKEKLQISASALVELKATLFSKRREVRTQAKKAASGSDGTTLSTNTVSEKTAAIWRKPPKQKKGGREGNARGAERQRTAQYTAEEEAALERSRRALEAKAKLYDRLCGGEGVRGGGSDSEGEEEGRYMVDFTRKIVEERKTQQSSSSSDTKAEGNDVIKEGVADEVGEWVEYVDSFGRTRRCPKEDLPHMRGTDEKRRERSPTPDLLSEDMARERERQRWEAELEEKVDRPIGPVHYEELRQGEVRTHGVGYYAFSQDEEKRTEQLNLLNHLRDQTVTQRERKAKLQEKRKAQMAARLEKVRQRKQLKQSATAEEENSPKDAAEEEEGSGGTDLIAAMIESQLSQAREKAEKEDEEESRKKKPYVRPWDKGKVVDPIRKRKKELEDERLPEFAPPSWYHKTTDQPKVTKLDQSDQTDDQSDKQDSAETTEVPKSENAEQSGAIVGSLAPPPQVQYLYQQQPSLFGPYPYPIAGHFRPLFVPPPPPFGPPPPHRPLLFGPPPPPPHGPSPFNPPPPRQPSSANLFPGFQPPFTNIAPQTPKL